MNLSDIVPLVISLLGALTAVYSVWLNGHKTRAEAQKIYEEAETEEAKQRVTAIENLCTINDEWQRQYGLLVQRMDALKAEHDAEVDRRRTVEEQSAARIKELEQQLENEYEARIAAEKRAQVQAQHLVDLQVKVNQMQGVIEAQNATISSLQKLVADKDRQIGVLRDDLAQRKLQQGQLEVQLNALKKEMDDYQRAGDS